MPPGGPPSTLSSSMRAPMKRPGAASERAVAELEREGGDAMIEVVARAGERFLLGVTLRADTEGLAVRGRVAGAAGPSVGRFEHALSDRAFVARFALHLLVEADQREAGDRVLEAGDRFEAALVVAARAISTELSSVPIDVAVGACAR